MFLGLRLGPSSSPSVVAGEGPVEDVGDEGLVAHETVEKRGDDAAGEKEIGRRRLVQLLLVLVLVAKREAEESPEKAERRSAEAVDVAKTRAMHEPTAAIDMGAVLLLLLAVLDARVADAADTALFSNLWRAERKQTNMELMFLSSIWSNDYTTESTTQRHGEKVAFT